MKNGVYVRNGKSVRGKEHETRNPPAASDKSLFTLDCEISLLTKESILQELALWARVSLS